jgi:hypothetical protein
VEQISLFGKGKTKIYGFGSTLPLFKKVVQKFGSTLPLFKKVVQKFGSTFSKGGFLKVDF